MTLKKPSVPRKSTERTKRTRKKLIDKVAPLIREPYAGLQRRVPETPHQKVDNATSHLLEQLNDPFYYEALQRLQMSEHPLVVRLPRLPMEKGELALKLLPAGNRVEPPTKFSKQSVEQIAEYAIKHQKSPLRIAKGLYKRVTGTGIEKEQLIKALAQRIYYAQRRKVAACGD